MKYNFREGVKLDKKKPIWLFWLLGLVVLAVGTYGVAQFIAPQLVSMPLSAKSTADATMQKMQATVPGQSPHLFVPQLNVDLPISSTQSAGSAWQKEEVNLEDDSSTLVLRATYLEHGITPWETRENSPFYNLDKLQKGDEVYVDYEGKRYAYRITQTNQADYQAEQTDKKLLILIPTDQHGKTAKNSIAIAEAKGVVGDSEVQ